MGVGPVLFRHRGAQGGRSAYPEAGPFAFGPGRHFNAGHRREDCDARCAGATDRLSAGHVGYSWTVEGGIVEVIDTGASIIRAPLANAFEGDRRIGREWWPSGERFESQWRFWTFATMAEAHADMVASRD